MLPTEEKTKNYFYSNGFPLKFITESSKKTPDFEGEEILVEVKKVSPQELEGEQPDTTYNAVKNNLKNAARKFREYDPGHSKRHIVVIFSSEIISEDIFSVWTGRFSPKNPRRFLRGGMILSREHRKQIDAVAWFKSLQSSKPTHVWNADDIVKKYFPDMKS